MATTRVRMDPRGMAKLRLRTSQLVQQLTDDVYFDARAMAAIDTGEMVSTLKARYPAWNRGRVYVGSDHWYFVEYGTRFMAAEPFMRPALYRVRLSSGSTVGT